MAKKETPFDKEIEELNADIKTKQVKLKSLEQLRAETLCPFTIGQVLISIRKGQKAKLDRIRPGGWEDYAMDGYFLKKDGTPGIQFRQLYQGDGWKLFEGA